MSNRICHGHSTSVLAINGASHYQLFAELADYLDANPHFQVLAIQGPHVNTTGPEALFVAEPFELAVVLDDDRQLRDVNEAALANEVWA